MMNWTAFIKNGMMKVYCMKKKIIKPENLMAPEKHGIKTES